MTNISHIRGDHFSLTCNLARDNTNWSGSTVTCQLRTSKGQIVQVPQPIAPNNGLFYWGTNSSSPGVTNWWFAKTNGWVTPFP